MKHNYIDDIRAICFNCDGLIREWYDSLGWHRVVTLAKNCPHKDCILWPFAGGKRKRPWPDRVQAVTYPPHKALKMYAERQTESE